MLARDRYAARQTYDDYDEYEEDGDDQEEEEEEEQEKEEEKPSKEVMDFLKLREKFKEKIRQKYKKENAAVTAPAHSLAKNGTTTDTKFGSFFGPSQRVIAPRVIEESRSIQEARHIVSKAPSSTVGGKPTSSNTDMKSHSSYSTGRPHKVVNDLKRKVQTLKERRDYSFLLSDDADLPSHNDEPPPKKAAVASSDAHSGRSLPPTKMSMSKPTKQIPESHLSRTAISRDQHMKKKVEYQKTIHPSRPKASSSEPRKMQGEHQKTTPPSRPKASSTEPRKLQGEHQKTIPPSRPKASSSEPRKVIEGRGGGGHSQPLASKASSLTAAQGTVVKKAPVMGGNRPSNIERAPLTTMTQSIMQKSYSQQKGEIHDMSKGKLMSKQMPSSKPQLSKPLKQIQQRGTHEERPKPKPKPKPKPVKSRSRNPFDDDDDDIDDPMSFLRNKLLSKYNSSKYQVDYDDDSDMEANFDDIMREELRSSRIAEQEDEEQLRLIEEEERRERMRKETKRRKVMQR